MRSAIELVVMISAGVAAVIALAVYGRKAGRWLRRAARDLGVLRDTMIGSDPVYHRVRRDEVVEPGKPGLAVRMDKIETTLDKLASSERRMDAIETDLVSNRAWAQAEHIALDHRIKALEDARVERTVARAESAAMWTAIAADRVGDTSAAADEPSADELPADKSPQD